jgi:hypothetical protein
MTDSSPCSCLFRWCSLVLNELFDSNSEDLLLKTAYYRRALWLNDGGPTLETILKDVLSSCPDVASTKFDYKKGVDAQIPERSEASAARRGTGIYLTLFKEGGRTATVQNGGPTVLRRSPPRGEEFVNTGIFLIAEGNHVGFVSDGRTNDGQLTGLFHRLFDHKGRPSSETQFALSPRADRKQIERLLRVGVKAIDLDVSAFSTTVADINGSATTGGLFQALGKIPEALRDIGRTKRSPAEAEAASRIQAKIHFGFDGRGADQLVPHILAQVAEPITEHGDGFHIVTNDDVIITREKLAIRRDINVEGDEVAASAESAFDGIRGAMRDWRRAGLFEQ